MSTIITYPGIFVKRGARNCELKMGTCRKKLGDGRFSLAIPQKTLKALRFPAYLAWLKPTMKGIQPWVLKFTRPNW